MYTSELEREKTRPFVTPTQNNTKHPSELGVVYFQHQRDIERYTNCGKFCDILRKRILKYVFYLIFQINMPEVTPHTPLNAAATHFGAGLFLDG